MATNQTIYKEQSAAFAQVKKVAEACIENETRFNTDQVIIEMLALYAVSERALQKYIDRLLRVYPELRFD